MNVFRAGEISYLSLNPWQQILGLLASRFPIKMEEGRKKVRGRSKGGLPSYFIRSPGIPEHLEQNICLMRVVLHQTPVMMTSNNMGWRDGLDMS